MGQDRRGGTGRTLRNLKFFNGRSELAQTCSLFPYCCANYKTSHAVTKGCGFIITITSSLRILTLSS